MKGETPFAAAFALLATAACSGSGRTVCDDTYSGPVLVVSAVDATTNAPLAGWTASWTCAPPKTGTKTEQGGGTVDVDLRVDEPGTYACQLVVALAGYEPSASAFSATFEGDCLLRKGATENRQVSLMKSK